MQRAPIRGDGTLGAWVATTSFTVDARTRLPLFAYNNKLYFIGGCNESGNDYDCNTNLADGQYAAINSDGSVGTWANLNSLPSGTRLSRGATAFIYKGYLMAALGNGNGENPLTTLGYAPVHASGAIGNWQTQTLTLNIPRSYEAVTVYNDHLMVVGGAVAPGPSAASPPLSQPKSTPPA